MTERETLCATVIRNAHLMDPRDRGIRHLLLVGHRIAHVAAEDFEVPPYFGPIFEFDLEGDFLLPGLVDGHVHILGGGGEGGPATRTPEITLSGLTSAGVTTAVGLLGTDSTTRSLEALLAKARALESEGLTVRAYTGAYRVPTPTVTGSVRDDIALLDRVVGAKVALSDHRASHPSREQLHFLASECRVGGMLGGKPGLLHVHVGEQESGLDPLFDVVESTGIPAPQLYPTHVGRSEDLLRRAAEFSRIGGFIDVTAGPRAAKAVQFLTGAAAELSRVTLSSDGNGSLPQFDENGQFAGLGVGSPRTLLETLRELVDSGWTLPRALPLFTINPARILGLEGKTGVVGGRDADLVCLTRDGLALRHVWAGGRIMVQEGEVVRSGTFEE